MLPRSRAGVGGWDRNLSIVRKSRSGEEGRRTGGASIDPVRQEFESEALERDSDREETSSTFRSGQAWGRASRCWARRPVLLARGEWGCGSALGIVVGDRNPGM